jgi:hypothetical protein
MDSDERIPVIRITTTARTWVWLGPLCIAGAILAGVFGWRAYARPEPPCADSWSKDDSVTCRADQDLVKDYSGVLCRCRREEVKFHQDATGKDFLCRSAPGNWP